MPVDLDEGKQLATHAALTAMCVSGAITATPTGQVVATRGIRPGAEPVPQAIHRKVSTGAGAAGLLLLDRELTAAVEPALWASVPEFAAAIGARRPSSHDGGGSGCGGGGGCGS